MPGPPTFDPDQHDNTERLEAYGVELAVRLGLRLQRGEVDAWALMLGHKVLYPRAGGVIQEICGDETASKYGTYYQPHTASERPLDMAVSAMRDAGVPRSVIAGVLSDWTSVLRHLEPQFIEHFRDLAQLG
jgi:hypothetical protein